MRASCKLAADVLAYAGTLVKVGLHSLFTVYMLTWLEPGACVPKDAPCDTVYLITGWCDH